MSGNETTVAALVDEIRALLTTASVGLYEFVWLLRSSLPNATDEERLDYARAALRDLLDDADTRLVLLEWPGERPVGETSVDRLPPEAWEDPVSGRPYVALVLS
jgi:hypothetical protein